MKNFKDWPDDMLVAWHAQSATPRQAAYYPGMRRMRARCLAEMTARGLPVRDTFQYPARPKGYGLGKNAYMHFWGVGGTPSHHNPVSAGLPAPAPQRGTGLRC